MPTETLNELWGFHGEMIAANLKIVNCRVCEFHTDHFGTLQGPRIWDYFTNGAYRTKKDALMFAANYWNKTIFDASNSLQDLLKMMRH